MFMRPIKLVFCCSKRLIVGLRKCSLQVNHELKSVIEPISGEQQKILKVAVIGMPNAGKSTFINNLMDRKVCATSSKVHTTRKKSRAIFTEGDSQIVFLDTPGLVNDREKKRFNLEKSFTKDSEGSLHEADIIGVIHDVGNHWEREKLDIKAIRLLETHKNISSFLVLNKVDMLKSKRKLLDITRLITENCIAGKPMLEITKQKERHGDMRGWSHFSEVFMISALTGIGMTEVKDFLIHKAKPGKWMYSSDVWSDQSAENIIVNVVKAKFLDFLPQELPYQVIPQIELFETSDEGVIKTVVLVKCPSERRAKLIAGEANGRLHQITESVQRDLQDTFQNFVKINIVLDAPKDVK